MYCTTVRIRPEVLVTHTKELGQIITAVHDTSTNLGRTASIPTAIAIAQLALKHRQNKNSRQRVIVFVGSPLEDASPDAERALVRLAKKLKKNNVALDVIAFGDGIEEAGEGGHSILRAFVESASSSDNSYVLSHPSILSYLSFPAPFLARVPIHVRNSLTLPISRHYLAVPPGPHLLSSMILNSPILANDRGIPDELAAAGPGAVGGAASGAGTSQFEFGVDPSLDPELAMVCSYVPITRFHIFSNLFFTFSSFPRPYVCLWKKKLHGRQQSMHHHHRHWMWPPYQL
jgi:26S proteasome regulatory subunit N10